MRNRLFNLLDELQASYWYIPSVMATIAVVGAILAITLDQRFGFTIAEIIPISSDPAGTRLMMSSLAGSVLGIAATSFSITIVAMTLASQQFGPRLLDNFMRDRGNQIVLGIFIAVPSYCLVVLWGIQGTEGAYFVPQLSVTIGVILGAFSFGALIYFIHHTAESIRVSNILNRVAQDMLSKADELYPSGTGIGVDEPPTSLQKRIPLAFKENSVTVLAEDNGYIQGIDIDRLFNLAKDNELLIKLLYNPGDYVTQGMPTAQIYPMNKATKEIAAEVIETVLLTAERSHNQDLGFMFRKMAETGIRALSPGVNDPYTATMSIDHLGAMLSRIVVHGLPSPYRMDEDDMLRLILPEITLETLLRISFEQMRFYAASDLTVITHLLTVLGIVAKNAHRAEDKAIIAKHIERTKTYLDAFDEAKWDVAFGREAYIKAIENLESTPEVVL